MHTAAQTIGPDGHGVQSRRIEVCIVRIYLDPLLQEIWVLRWSALLRTHERRFANGIGIEPAHFVAV